MQSLLLPILIAHSTGVLLVLGWLGTAFMSTVPDQRPKNLDDAWSWGREFIHQVGNAKRPSLPKL